MTRAEAIERWLSGWFVIVGEFRGWATQSQGYLDRKTGLASKRMVMTYIVECTVAGAFGAVKIIQRLPEAVSDPSQVTVTLERGKRYAFEVDGLKKENGYCIAWLGLRDPVPIE
jgi:hypothetical protein